MKTQTELKHDRNTATVLITGALTGIGRATALAFAQEGARVVVSGRHEDEGLKLATELRKFGTEAEFVRTDVRHEEEVHNLVDRTVARFGRLDIAVKRKTKQISSKHIFPTSVSALPKKSPTPSCLLAL